MSVADARSASTARGRSQPVDRTAEVQQPMGQPDRGRVGLVAERDAVQQVDRPARAAGARTTALETARTGPSRAVARSMRSASGLS